MAGGEKERREERGRFGLHHLRVRSLGKHLSFFRRRSFPSKTNPQQKTKTFQSSSNEAGRGDASIFLRTTIGAL
ncbi:hypothetical protein AAC387_Pa05g0935 [Persea americana]